MRRPAGLGARGQLAVVGGHEFTGRLVVDRPHRGRYGAGPGKQYRGRGAECLIWQQQANLPRATSDQLVGAFRSDS